MTIPYLTLYTLICIFCFCAIIKHLRKIGYIDQEDLFFTILSSIVWPVTIVIVLVIKFFEWLEKVVNK